MTGAAFLRRHSLYVLIALLAIILVWASLTTPGFFTLGNGQAILASTVFVGMVATGMTLVMVSGAFVSLAMGTTATVSGMVFMAFLGLGLVPAIILTLLLGMVLGLMQGIVIGGWNANPVIVTIAVAAVVEGIAVAMSAGATVTPTGTAYQLLNTRFLGLPVGFYALAVLVLTVEAMLRVTRLGRMIYLAGDKRSAARAAALPLGAISAGVFAIASASASLAGIFMASFNHSASLLLNRGTLGYDAIAAVLIGGTAIGGGRGTVLRSMFGVIVIAVASDLVLLRGFSTGAQILLKGLVMIAFALAVHIRQERSS